MKTAISILLSLVITGCSCFVPGKQTLTISVTPADSILFINGQFAPDRPVIAKVARDSRVQLKCMKEGYYPYEASVGEMLSTTGMLDAIGGFLWLVPFAGIFTPGAYCLEDDEINIVLHQVVK